MIFDTFFDFDFEISLGRFFEDNTLFFNDSLHFVLLFLFAPVPRKEKAETQKTIVFP